MLTEETGGAGGIEIEVLYLSWKWKYFHLSKVLKWEQMTGKGAIPWQGPNHSFLKSLLMIFNGLNIWHMYFQILEWQAMQKSYQVGIWELFLSFGKAVYFIPNKMSDKESSVLKENRWRLKIKKHLRLEGVIEGDRGMGTSSLWPCTWWHQFGLGCLRRHLPGKRETHKMNSDSFLSFFLWPRGLWDLSSPTRDWICAPWSESSGMPGNSLSYSFLSQLLKWKTEDFPGGTVDKSLPANAGDAGLIPDLGRFHRPWSN